MKSLTVACLVAGTLFAPASAVHAQVPMTFKGGINLTNFVGGDAGATEQSSGLNLGASFGVFRVSRVQIMAEVYYRQKGATGSLSDLSTFALAEDGSAPALQDIEVGLDYVEVPLLAHIDLGGGTGKLFPYLFGGPAFGWKLSCGIAVTGAAGQPETKCDDLTQNLESTLRSYDLGMVVGAGVDFALPGGVGALNLDARYTGGLSTIGEGDDALDIRNQAFTVMLGYSVGMPGMGR